jgi:hypothetical protein
MTLEMGPSGFNIYTKFCENLSVSSKFDCCYNKHMVNHLEIIIVNYLLEIAKQGKITSIKMCKYMLMLLQNSFCKD